MRIVHRGRWFVLCGAISALLAATPAMAAVNAYMILTGARQGPIRSVGTVDKIPLISVARNPQMGSDLPTGRRTHSTLTVTRKLDAASPKLATALNSNETLKTVTIVFEGASGNEKTAQKIVLTNANIVSLRYAGGNEVITFDYQAIEVDYTKGGKTATDDWEAPN